MAESPELMDRLERIESDVGSLKAVVVHIGDILVGHGERLDSMQRSMDSMQRSMEQRLDRLIAVTIEERTLNYARLGDIERRLTKLEERVGV